LPAVNRVSSSSESFLTLPRQQRRRQKNPEVAASPASATAARRTPFPHVGKTRIVGKNYITRCPSCAQAGHDRGGDNLAILVSDPRFYVCWAGCRKEMIRAAIGHPIPVRQTA